MGPDLSLVNLREVKVRLTEAHPSYVSEPGHREGSRFQERVNLRVDLSSSLGPCGLGYNFYNVGEVGVPLAQGAGVDVR